MKLIFYAFAFVCFVLAATNLIPEPHRTRLIAAGLAFLTLGVSGILP